MKTLLIAGAALFFTVSLSALNTDHPSIPPGDETYSANFQDSTKKKKDKKKKDSTDRKDTAFVQYHR
ncbi:hypothetical protein [Paraflavitalea sp. CAU 1676]|uniref:hypothetical protein n=1 Tax=Paraflavitalea sp. CAU 1676 TaxID=3032598 RepID=UPI0023DC9B31|nr:hypothetical protein [Paraflavitalea sp. CAU 1676]MDF2187245.1 hypothetical protein [Paraflavitalea sp. CAU 1676]